MLNINETIGQTAIRIVREWLKLRAEADPDDRYEVEADADLVIAWLLGKDTKGRRQAKQ